MKLSRLVLAGAWLAAAGLTATGVTGCASPPAPAAPGVSSPAAPGVSSPAAPAETVKIDIVIAGGQITPSGQKVAVRLGQTVVLNVRSDIDDEIHAHTGGDGYELQVVAGKVATGSFTLNSPGSFEVESHHLEKTAVILNAS